MGALAYVWGAHYPNLQMCGMLLFSFTSCLYLTPYIYILKPANCEYMYLPELEAVEELQ